MVLTPNPRDQMADGGSQGTRQLRAGPLDMTFESGSLRWIRLGEIEVLRGIYGAVRDGIWGTVQARIDQIRITERARSFEVSFASHHESGDIAFSWKGEIAGRNDGRVRFDFRGTAESTFARNRIGLCVLHPMDLAGTPVVAETRVGATLGEFPVDIVPDVVFTDVIGYRWQAAPEVGVLLRFSGDLFEMEDQRNWTDGSFKTYCTPTHLPFPVEIQKGGRVEQSVTLELEPGSGFRSRTPQVAKRPRPSEVISIGAAGSTPMPQLGIPLAPGRERLDEAQALAIERLRLGHVRAVIELYRPRWRDVLDAAVASARRLGCALELEVVAGDQGQGLDALTERLKRVSIPLATMYAFQASETVTTAPIIEKARQALEDAGLDIMLGGGSRANFAEFNMGAVPIEQLEIAGFAMNAQAHAFDDRSVIETIPAQALVAANARRLCRDIPFGIGPITLLPRIDANAPMPHVLSRETEATRSDARQSTAFGAAWTVGSLAALAKAGARSLTYFEATGPAGVVHETSDASVASVAPGLVLPPVYLVLEAIGELDRPAVIDSSVAADIALLSLRHSAGTRVLVANLGSSATHVRLRLTGSRSLLAQQIVGSPDAAWQAVENMERNGVPTASGHPVVDLSMPAYGVARVDGRP